MLEPTRLIICVYDILRVHFQAVFNKDLQTYANTQASHRLIVPCRGYIKNGSHHETYSNSTTL